MRSITRLIELRESADGQIATVVSKALWEISWGRPKDFDPKAEEGERRLPIDPSQFTVEELEQLMAAVALIARKQRVMPPEEGKDVAG
jgi:hypothetical protein